MKTLITIILLLSPTKCAHQTNVKIAIVGGGIGGTSCAYFLNEIFNEKAEIHVYEGNKIGGRLATSSMTDGNEYETGGALIHTRNKYMSDFVNDLGLKRRTPPSNERFGLFNGNDFDVIDGKCYFMNVFKILWRYGYSAVKLQSFIEKIMDKFDRIYKLQKEDEAFNDLHDLLEAVDPTFVNYLNMSVKDAYLKNEGFSESTVNELVQASLQYNYGQTVNVPQCVGFVSMAGMDRKLWSVNEGNRRVPERLLEESTAQLIQDFVLSVSNNHSNYIVSTATNNVTYDYVIIATPLSQNQKIPLRFENFHKSIPRVGKYHRTVNTLILGKLNKNKFQAFNDNENPLIIINTNDDDFFNLIGNFQGVNGIENLNAWKVFSKKPLTNDEIDQLFENHTEVKIIDWLAYPRYVVPSQPRTFSLAPRLYHINAIEWAASAMEMSCIGAKNVALLIKLDYGKSVDAQTTKRSHMEL